MLISLHDNYQRRIAHIDNALPKAMHYNDDKWNRNLTYGTGVFEFTIDRQNLEIESQLVVGNYISFRYNNRDYMFTILRSEKSSDDRKIIVHSEYLSLGLLKSTQDPIDPPQSHTLEWYLTQSGILVNSGIKLGINEVPDLVRKIKIDGEQTSLQRLTSFATNFGAEIEYVTTLNRDGTLKSLVVNFYKKFDGVNQGVGTNRQDLTLSYGKNVSGIKQTTDITDFFSMITPKGKDGLTITSLDRTEYDDKGNILFFTRPGQSSIYAPQSAQRFPSRLIRANNDYTDHKYSADGTTDQNTLYTLALTELKKHCDPSIVYDVTGYYDLNIGDAVKIFDASFNPPLMLQARVAEQTISFSNPSNNKTVFGNIIALESQASQDLAGRLKELVDQATPYRFEIVSDNGLTFKNNEGTTTLTARVFKGSNVDEVSVDSFEWIIDGVSFGSTSKSQLINASQVTGTAVVRYNAKIGNTVIGGLEATLQDVSDGTDGISPTVKINPDTSLTIVDAKGTITTPVLKGSDGKDGTSGIIVSSVAPDSPQNGQLWQDTSTTPHLVKKWTGSSWVIWELYAQNLKADSLSALTSVLGDVTAGTVKLMDNIDVNGTLKKYGIYQSKFGLLSSGPTLATPSTMSKSQMGVANLSKGELRFIVNNYTEDLKIVQESGMSDQNTAFIKFNSYDNGKDVMLISSSGDIVFNGITSQDTPWIAMSNGTYYKNMFSRVYISYSIEATSTANIPLGVLPVGLRPFRGLHLTANAWGTTISNDRHIEVRPTGEVTLYNPVNGANYDGEVSFTL